MSVDLKDCTEEALWHFVASHLKKRDIDAVLVGGSLVSIYSKGAYRSGDLDLVLASYFVDNLDEVMGEIGFLRQGRHFVHPECSHLFVEFPPGPLSIGDDTRIVPDEVLANGVRIKLLSPTDCVRDRLGAYMHYPNARDCLDQAALVAAAHPVNWVVIERWCGEEGKPEACEELRHLLRRSVN